jgi:hypothetical protein
MMPISSPFREPSLLSPRTAKYVEAMIREGDSFDYHKWLGMVREEEAQAKLVSAAAVSHQQSVSAQLGRRLGATHNQHVWPRGTPAIMATPVAVARARGRSIQDPRGKTSKARLRRWLEKVKVACEHFQASRARDAVYEYLDAVFSIVMHYKVRRRSKRLLRHAFRFAKLQFVKNVDPFTALIRSTCGGAADNKMISKWARALRYAARCKPAEMRLKAFMKTAGGVNGCAAGYARLKGRS